MDATNYNSGKIKALVTRHALSNELIQDSQNLIKVINEMVSTGALKAIDTELKSKLNYYNTKLAEYNTIVAELAANAGNPNNITSPAFQKAKTFQKFIDEFGPNVDAVINDMYSAINFVLTKIHAVLAKHESDSSPQWKSAMASIIKYYELVDKLYMNPTVRTITGGQPYKHRESVYANVPLIGATRRGYATEVVISPRREVGDMMFRLFGFGRYITGRTATSKQIFKQKGIYEISIVIKGYGIARFTLYIDSFKVDGKYIGARVENITNQNMPINVVFVRTDDSSRGSDTSKRIPTSLDLILVLNGALLRRDIDVCRMEVQVKPILTPVIQGDQNPFYLSRINLKSNKSSPNYNVSFEKSLDIITNPVYDWLIKSLNDKDNISNKDIRNSIGIINNISELLKQKELLFPNHDYRPIDGTDKLGTGDHDIKFHPTNTLASKTVAEFVSLGKNYTIYGELRWNDELKRCELVRLGTHVAPVTEVAISNTKNKYEHKLINMAPLLERRIVVDKEGVVDNSVATYAPSDPLLNTHATAVVDKYSWDNKYGSIIDKDSISKNINDVNYYKGVTFRVRHEGDIKPTTGSIIKIFASTDAGKYDNVYYRLAKAELISIKTGSKVSDVSTTKDVWHIADDEKSKSDFYSYNTSGGTPSIAGQVYFKGVIDIAIKHTTGTNTGYLRITSFNVIIDKDNKLTYTPKEL